MPDPTFRPKRPTAARQEAQAAAAKLSEDEARLSVRFSKDSLWAIKIAAGNSRMTVKAFVAKALKDAGVEMAPGDMD